MAKGDSITDVQDIAAASNLDFQPGAGVEVVITEVPCEPIGTVKLIDASQQDAIVAAYASAEDRTPIQLHINNTTYYRLTNGGGGNGDLGYSGIQTK